MLDTGDPRPPAPRALPPTLSDRLPVLAAVVLGVLALGRGWVSDDGYITFRVVDMLWSGHGPNFNPGERVQAFTHPLWFFYLAASGRLGIDLYYAAVLGGVACAAGTAYLVAKLLPPLSAVVVVALLATSPAFLDFSTSGLENSLTHLLIAAMLSMAFGGDGPLDTKRASRLVLFGGLAVLNRLDIVLLVGPVLGLVVVSRPRSVLSLWPIVLWMLVAAWYYGTPLPNTFYAKVGVLGIGESIRHGLSYLGDYVLVEPLHATVAVIGVALGIRAGRSKSWPEILHREQLLLLACCVGVLLYVLYVIYVGGDFMRGRMFTACFLVSLIVIGLVLAIEGPALTPATASLAVALCVAALLVANTTQYDNRIPDSGIGNERANYQPLWLTQRRAQNRPPSGLERPDSVAVALRAYADAYGTIAVRGAAIGQFAFFSGDRVTVLDGLGLTDAYVAREPPQPDQRPGHINRNVMQDYFRVRGDITLQKDWLPRVRALDPTLREAAVKAAAESEWYDKDAQRRYQDVQQLVAGPLSPGSRLGMMLKYILPSSAHLDPNAVLAQSGDVAVRANYRPVFGSFNTLIGLGEGAGDGADWFDPKAAVALNDPTSRVTVDLGGDHTLSGVSLQGDANDTYVVRFSSNGRDFGSPWVAGPVKDASGLQTRRTADGFSTKARYVQIGVLAGDNFYSLGRLEVITEAGRPARAPGQPALAADAAVAGDGQAVLTWKAPSDGGRQISKYVVKGMPGNIVIAIPAPATTTIIPGLENGTEYRFTVTATNEVGDGPPSSPSNPVTPAEKVVATRGNIKVRATFTPRSGRFDALLVDPIPPDGLPFLDANLAFAWNDPAGKITVDLGQAHALTKITFQADNNDSYVIEFSVDGKAFGEAQLFAPFGAPGLRTRETPAGFNRQARYLRIGGAVGDATFAMGALEAFTSSGPVIRR